MTSSVFGAAGAGVLTEAGEPNTGTGAEAGVGGPNDGGVVEELLVEEPNVRPVEGALVVFVTAAGVGTPNENVGVGAEVVVAGAAVETEVGFTPKLKVLSFLSTSSLAGVLAPKPKEKFEDGWLFTGIEGRLAAGGLSSSFLISLSFVAPAKPNVNLLAELLPKLNLGTSSAAAPGLA